MKENKNIKLIIFDWGRTLYDPETGNLFPDTKSVLNHLSSKYSLAIVALATAGRKKVEERLCIIKDEKLEKYFDSILFDQFDKDNLYKKTLKVLDVQPEETVIVDDRVVRGVRWGNKNGAVTIWFQNGKFKNELPNNETGKPDYIIKNLSEIEL